MTLLREYHCGKHQAGVLIAGVVWVEMTFGVCPFGEKGLGLSEKNLYGGIPVHRHDVALGLVSGNRYILLTDRWEATRLPSLTSEVNLAHVC